MRTRKPSVEIPVRGTLVGFLRRDVRQLTDSEREQVERLVDELQRESGSDRMVTRLVIETDQPDPDRISYTASYRVHVEGRVLDDEPGECDAGDVL